MRADGGGEPGGVIDAAENSHGPIAGRPPRRCRHGQDGVPPQGGGGGAEGEPADPAGLGRSDDLVGGAPGDGQHVTVQVGELQGRELAAPGAGVGGQPGQQQQLLGPVQPRTDRSAPVPVTAVVTCWWA